jgi:hypothetical protein
MEGPTIADVARLIARSTCQLFNFKIGTAEFPDPNGCSILFQFNGKYFCISNAHVLADNNLGKTFFLLGSGKTSNLGGHFLNTSLPTSGNRQDDTIDIAIIYLEKETIEALLKRGYQFLNIDEIKTGYNSIESDSVLVIGYPASQTKIDVKNKNVISKPFFLSANPFTKNLYKIKYPRDFHIIVSYPRKKIKHPILGVKRGPYPRGMSGCGFWHLEKKEGKYYAYLVGILSEYHQNRSLLIGTKIDIFIDTIKQLIDSKIPNHGVKVKLLK